MEHTAKKLIILYNGTTTMYEFVKKIKEDTIPVQLLWEVIDELYDQLYDPSNNVTLQRAEPVCYLHKWETEPVDNRRCVKCGCIEKNYEDINQEYDPFMEESRNVRD